MSVKWNAATRYSAHPFTTKTGARVHFFCLNYPRIRGWYQARVHPFSSGNGKGDVISCYIPYVWEDMAYWLNKSTHRGYQWISPTKTLIKHQWTEDITNQN